jgi:hypothetical protein
MLTNAIEQAKKGKSEIFANYRATLTDLFKTANQMLTASVKNAVGIRGKFVSFPVNDKMITGPAQIVSETMDLGGTRLLSCAVKVNDLNIPVLPLEAMSSDISDQCLRQYIRMIIGSQYGVDKLGDGVIYMVIGLMMLVVNSSASSEIKNAYRHFSRVMLRKKRLNTNITELARLEAGEYPTPNSGKIEHFNQFMATVNGILGTTAEPMVLWCAMLQSLDDSRLLLKQMPHYQEAVLAAYGEIPENIGALLLAGVVRPEVATISENATLDYTCLITLAKCDTQGGHRLLPHTSPTGQNCCPIYVFSEEGYQQFVTSNDLYCPVCYTIIRPDGFELVPPRLADVEIFHKDLTSVYTGAAAAATRGGYAGSSSQTSSFAPPTREPTRVATSLSKQNKHLFKMEGDVGAGKTTTANAFEQTLNSLGLNITVFNVSTDMHCKKGVNPKGAVNNVKAQLKN